MYVQNILRKKYICRLEHIDSITQLLSVQMRVVEIVQEAQQILRFVTCKPLIAEPLIIAGKVQNSACFYTPLFFSVEFRITEF